MSSSVQKNYLYFLDKQLLRQKYWDKYLDKALLENKMDLTPSTDKWSNLHKLPDSPEPSIFITLFHFLYRSLLVGTLFFTKWTSLLFHWTYGVFEMPFSDKE